MINQNNTQSLNRTATFLLLLTILLVLLPPYIIFVGQPSPVRSMESICMQTSVETWLRIHAGESMAWWTPSWDGGITRIEKPPMLVWLNLLAWRNLSPDSATIEQLTFGARLATIFVILIGLGALFYIGRELRNLYAACMAILITGTMFLMIKQSHYATYDAQLMGWATLAVAFGVRAINPNNQQHLIKKAWPFWTLSGVFLGVTMMTKGPVGAVWVMSPLLILIMLIRKNIGKNMIGLIGCIFIGSLIMVPWFVHVSALQSEAVSTLAEEYKPIDTDQFRPLYYYLALVILIFPWTFWGIASVIFPFRKENRNPINFFPLLWFFVCFAFLCAWPMRHQRYLVPVLPAIGLMTAFYLDHLVQKNQKNEGPHWLLIIFWTLATVITIVLPTYIILEPWLISIRAIDEAQFADINLPGGLAAGAILMLMCACGMISAQTKLTQKAFVYIATWMIILSTLVYYGYSLADHQFYEYKKDAVHYASISGGQPSLYLYEANRESTPRPAIGFTIYAMKLIRPASKADVEKKVAGQKSFSLLIETNSPSINDFLSQAIYEGLYEDDDHYWHLLSFNPEQGKNTP